MDIQDLQSALFSKFQANPSSKGFLIMLATATVPSTYLMYSDLISWNLSPASVLLATVSQTEWYLRNDRGLIFVRSSPRWSAQRVDAFAVVVCNGLEAGTESDMISQYLALASIDMWPQAVAWSVSTATKAALQAQLHCCSELEALEEWARFKLS